MLVAIPVTRKVNAENRGGSAVGPHCAANGGFDQASSEQNNEE